jgi:death on curing protein
MTDDLTVAEVPAMHADQIGRYGGPHGVRDPGLLEAARYRPQTGYYADLIEEAATYTFLAINGASLTADSGETYALRRRSLRSQPVQIRQARPLAPQSRYHVNASA